MKIPVIKQLVERYSPEELARAEEAILDGAKPEIEIEGEDEGEQLTHAFAARYVVEAMQGGKDFREALREYTQKVRSSIS